MFKKKLYIFNIKSLINSNLLIIKVRNQRFSHKQQIKSQNLFFFLEPLEYIKNLKQTIRLLQFLKNKKNSYLYIDLMDVVLKQLLITLFKIDKKPKVSIFLIKSYYQKPIGEQLKTFKKNSEFYLFLNENSLRSGFIKYLFLQKIYLIKSINSNFEFNDLNYYKFYSDLNYLKNFFFLVLLLKKNL
jgi:hypothetical protein